MSHAPGAFGVDTDGPDLVVGDVHGCFRTLARALDAMEYEAGYGRLFGVGDLVNRGPHSAEAIECARTALRRRRAGQSRSSGAELVRGEAPSLAAGWV